jgi:opacity protein-like surface antigen
LSSFAKRRTCFSAPLLLCFFFPLSARSQATHAASRIVNVQIGAGYSNANPNYDYVTNRIAGLYFYSDFDFKPHFGAEFSFHQLNDPNSPVYQRSFEIGGRYFRHYTVARVKFEPYAKLQYGVGVLNFPAYANLGYNLLAASAGVDFSVRPRISVRAEFEYQDWFAAPGPGLTLNPSMISIGAAYRFGTGHPKVLRH